MADTSIKYTAAILREYSRAAIENAGHLLAEAKLLQAHGHIARAYFLAVASIEETGKAFLAYDSQYRNFEDPAVNTKLSDALCDHKQKISAAFTAWLVASNNYRETLIPAAELMVHLRRGREPSMYTDIRPSSLEVKRPSVLVREVAADDCIRLAEKCLHHAQRHFQTKSPQTPTRVQDQFFSMPSRQVTELMSNVDFWWFYLSELEAGKHDLAAAIRKYRSEFQSKGRIFKPEETE